MGFGGSALLLSTTTTTIIMRISTQCPRHSHSHSCSLTGARRSLDTLISQSMTSTIPQICPPRPPSSARPLSPGISLQQTPTARNTPFSEQPYASYLLCWTRSSRATVFCTPDLVPTRRMNLYRQPPSRTHASPNSLPHHPLLRWKGPSLYELKITLVGVF